MTTTPASNHEPENLSQLLVDASDQGLCLIELSYDQAGKLTDLIVRKQNQAFDRHTGLGNVVGKNLRQLLPQYETYWMDIFDQVDRTRETSLVEGYVQDLGRWFKAKFSLTGQPGSTFVAVTIEDITASKKREQALLDGEAKYRTLFDSIEEGLTIFGVIRDKAGQLIDARYQALNRAVQQQTGLDPRTILGRRLSEVLPQADWDRWMPLIAQVLASGESVSFEEYVALIDRWYTASFYPLSEDKIASFYRDITERKRQEQEQSLLLTLSDELRPLTDPVSIEGRVTQVLRAHVDAGWCYYVQWDEVTKLGVVHRDATRKGLASLVGDHDVSDVPEFLALLKANPLLNVSDYEHYDMLTPALRDRYTALGFRSMLVATLVKQERLVASLLIGDTIIRQWSIHEETLLMQVAERTWAAVERAKAEAALHTSNAYLNTVLDVLPVGLAIADASGKVLRFNEALTRIWGIPPIPERTADYAAWKGHFVDSGQPLTADDWAMARTLATGQPVVGDVVEIERFDGGRATIINAATPIKDKQDHILGGVVVELDITSQRATEEALRQADRRKDEFLAMLAHELRNPMSTLRSGLGILDLTLTEEMARSTVAMMSRQTDHLVHMMDDLLDVSRISQGKIELQLERVNLTELVQQAVASVQAQFEQQGKTLVVHLPELDIKLEGDATRLTQVVTNLLTNGIRYTGEQGQVWLRMSHQHKEAILQVRDNGIGLAADQLSAIFELFVQVDNSLARSKGGLGLGLTLVKRLVEMHGGRVEAGSDGLGQGSTFTVYLPILTTAADPTPLSSLPQVSDPATTRRILVIDDNADAALMMTMLLKLKGYETQSWNSGRSGIEAAERWQPEAILLDIGMPELDGYATCGLIRQQAWGQEMVIIALTGYGQEEDRQRTNEAGFDGHLVKPVDLEALTKMLTDLLNKKQN